MPGRRTTLKPSAQENIIHKPSIDLFSDVIFLTGYISIDDPLFFLLASGRVTNSSFSALFQRSQQIGWTEVIREERSNLKLDEKSKPKRFMLNRLIEASSENVDNFNTRAQQLNDEMQNQISPKLNSCDHLRTKDDIYNEIKSWRQLQCERRLFYKKCDSLCNLIALQQLLTDQYISLMTSQSVPTEAALIELFDHALIIVVQPSGTDCAAVTKYEKVGKEYVAKIKTRIICLLDPKRLEGYLKPTLIDVTLFPQNRELDPTGDIQASMEWKKQTVITNTGERIFWYAELNENDSIRLTKLNPKRKPLYNGGLCNLDFRARFTIIGTPTNFEVISPINSQYFGLCSHAKYCPKYLAKVFIEEVNKMYKDIQLQTHTSILVGYICELHKLITGVAVKSHTQQYIEEELQIVYDSIARSAASPTTPVMIFDLNIYETILEKLFTQIKFMGSHPFLSMMYHDSLFCGVCSDAIERKIIQGTTQQPQLIMRFELFKNQNVTKSPNIVVVMYNGFLSEATITHEYFIDALFKCFYEAAENQTNQSLIFANDNIVPFRNLRWYYDADIHPYTFKQIEGRTIYNSLESLLKNTMNFTETNPPTTSHEQSQQLSNGQPMITSTVTLSAELTGNRDFAADAIRVLQNAFSEWCLEHNIRGSLVPFVLIPPTASFDDETFFSMTDSNIFDIGDEFK